MMKEKELSTYIKNKTKELGFDYCGISEAEFLGKDAPLVENWLEKQMHGEMRYLENNKEKRYDPSQLLEGTKTVVSVLLNYYPSQRLPEENNYKIAKYAYGQDYHFVMKDKLNALLEDLQQIIPETEGRAFVDSAPLLDRAWAKRSGLGFIGKNTCLINKKTGSFFFIGQLLLNIPMEYDHVVAKDYCGTCTRCIDNCPTGALVAPHQLDSRKCISYLTIEYKGELPEDFKPKFKDWIFGCDICQDVCPWNKFSKDNHNDEFQPKEDLLNLKTKEDWENLTPDQFGRIFKGSAVKRTKYKGLKRNIDFLKGE